MVVDKLGIWKTRDGGEAEVRVFFAGDSYPVKGRLPNGDSASWRRCGAAWNDGEVDPSDLVEFVRGFDEEATGESPPPSPFNADAIEASPSEPETRLSKPDFTVHKMAANVRSLVKNGAKDVLLVANVEGVEITMRGGEA